MMIARSLSPIAVYKRVDNDERLYDGHLRYVAYAAVATSKERTEMNPCRLVPSWMIGPGIETWKHNHTFHTFEECQALCDRAKGQELNPDYWELIDVDYHTTEDRAHRIGQRRS